MREAEPLWAWFDAMMRPPEPVSEREPSSWAEEKQSNRLRRAVEKVESGRWLPRAAYQLSGRAQRELKEAVALLGAKP